MPRWIKLAFCSKQLSLAKEFNMASLSRFLRALFSSISTQKRHFLILSRGITNVAHCCLDAGRKSAALLWWSRKIIATKTLDSLSLIMRQSVSLSQSYGVPRAKTGPFSEHTACWVLWGKRCFFSSLKVRIKTEEFFPRGGEKAKRRVKK